MLIVMIDFEKLEQITHRYLKDSRDIINYGPEKVIQFRLKLRSWHNKLRDYVLDIFCFQSRRNLIELLPDFMNLCKWPLKRRRQSL